MKSAIRFIFVHLRKEWKSLTLLLISLNIKSVLEIISPVYYKKLVDVIAGGNFELSVLHQILLSILVINLIAWVARRLFDFTMVRVELRVMKRINDESHAYLQRHSYDFFVNNFAGALVKKLTRLPRGFETIFDNFSFNLYPLIIQLSVAIFIIWRVEYHLALVILGWVAIYVVVSIFISKYKTRQEIKGNEIDSKLSGVLADNVTNNFNISLFATHQKEQKNIEGITELWRKTWSRGWYIGSLGDSFLALLMIGLEFLIFYMALGYYQNKSLTIGDFVLLQSLLMQIYGQIWMIGRILREFGRGFADMKEMLEVLNTPHEIVNKPDATELKVQNGEIRFSNLKFGYNGDRGILNQLNLTIKPHTRVALVSRSGGGKSTIVKLLLRLYNVCDRSIFIDGQDINDVTLDSLRKNISLVPQDPVLFHRTLRENIAYGKPDATLEEVIEAAKKAHCHEFISQLPDGYDTYVGERGVKLSGGERQRVAIARAILENAPILILDEATSALDSESEQLIQEALHELMKNKTTIAIAHRLSTIAQMDEIIVLENGRVVESGHHELLLNSDDSRYKRLWEIQVGGFSH